MTIYSLLLQCIYLITKASIFENIKYALITLH